MDLKQVLIEFFFFSIYISTAYSQTIWSIGQKDNSADEFALAPGKYRDFLKNDFGWENKSYIVGFSSPEKDFPYILPGPADQWAGTGTFSGIRTHVLNILFRMQEIPDKTNFNLIIDLLDTHSKIPPLLKVVVNNRPFYYKLPSGGTDASLDGDFAQAKNHTIEIPASNFIKEGENTISLTSIEGSWIIFDAISFISSKPIHLHPINKLFIRDISDSNYETVHPDAQPLLVDVEHLEGNSELIVKLDGKTIFSQRPETGRYIFEVPMPAVKDVIRSEYEILIDGKTYDNGYITRSPQPKITPTDYVDTHMGTAHSRWMIAPGPWMPFSMVKLSPDNQNSGWQAGYDPSFESIGTFSHIHEWTMAGLGIMPVNGMLKTRVGDQSSLNKDESGYRSAIDKATEETQLGYYRAHLTDYDIIAELTATDRCSFQRYTFPKDTDGRVMIDLKIPAEYGYDILKASLKKINDYKIEGFSKQLSKNVWSEDADQEYTIHFVIEFDRPIKNFGGWIDENIQYTNIIEADNPHRIGCFAEFDSKNKPVVQVRTGISFISIDGARLNLEKEITVPFDWNFDEVRQHNKNEWNKILSRIDIHSNDRREKMRFYTNMYRSYCRNTFSDIDGKWMDATNEVHQFTNSDDRALGCDAFWNTFWNLNQLWNLVTPEWSSRWVKSQLAMYDANGWLAKGPAGMKYIPVMVGEHEIPLIVSTYQMGIRDYDAEKAFEAIKKMQTTPAQKVGSGFAGNRDLLPYLKYKYVPADLGRFSNTLEYSFDDWSVSQMAKSLGKAADYEIFIDRGNWWKNAIDTVSGYARMRHSDGSWEKDFDPLKSGANHHYVEGNAWQLSHFVPQNVPELAKMIGKERFIERLQKGFEDSEIWRYNAPGDQYWDIPVVQGNQQSMHFAFLFNWVGESWQTQKWSRSILDRYYGYEASDAYLGDEDQGQMSAWFVMAAIGLFQTDGGVNAEPVYEIASPVFKKITINLGKQYGRGEQFTIQANNASRLNKYVQSATLNGNPLNNFSFPASELLKGGTLVLEMSSSPNKNWGNQK